MTAIAAIFNRDDRPVARGDLDRIARTLACYGTDRQQVALHGEAGLACALNAYTPEDVGQAQPVSGGNGRFAMVFEGRIDNRAEVAEALGLASAEVARMSDAALAMRSFERWGIDSFTRWIAEFALILWDGAEHRLILARDPFGMRGLVYYDTPGQFVAATLPKGIHALPDVPRELDEQKLADALCQLPTDTVRTFFKHITMLAAGHCMTVTREGTRIERYYRFRDHVREIRYAKDDDYVEAARELFQKAVESRLRSNGPVGAFMSGGLDSSTGAIVAADMLAQRGRRLPTFTWVPEAGWDGRTESHCYGDETPYVRAIAEQHPNIELNLIDSAGRSHYHQQDEMLRLGEMPMRNAGNLHWMHSIMQAARDRGIRVMLSGDVGNMTLTYRGDGIYHQLWKSRRYGQLWRELRLSGRNPVGMLRYFYRFVGAGMMSDAMWDARERLTGGSDFEARFQRHVSVTPEFGRQMQVRERARATGFTYFGRPPAIGREWWYWTMEQTLGINSPFYAGYHAAHNVETRDPFGDRRLTEWCFGVPEDQYHRNGVGRWLIKRVMQGRTPDDVLHKPRDVGRQNSDWHVRMTRDLPRIREDLEKMAQDPDLTRMIDIPRLQGLLDDWPEHTITDGQDDRRFYLMMFLPMALQIGRFVQLDKGMNA